MTFKIRNTYVKIKFLFVALLTFLMFASKDGVFMFCYAASMLHELGHIAAVYLCGDKIDSIVFEVYGILIDKHENTSYFQQIFILLSGPAINIILGIIFAYIPVQWCGLFSKVNIVLGIFNLLPINGLDGGEVLLRTVEYFLGFRAANIISICVSILALFPIALVCFYNFLEQKNNYSLIIVFLFLVLSVIRSARE